MEQDVKDGNAAMPHTYYCYKASATDEAFVAVAHAIAAYT